MKIQVPFNTVKTRLSKDELSPLTSPHLDETGGKLIEKKAPFLHIGSGLKRVDTSLDLSNDNQKEKEEDVHYLTAQSRMQEPSVSQDEYYSVNNFSESNSKQLYAETADEYNIDTKGDKAGKDSNNILPTTFKGPEDSMRSCRDGSEKDVEETDRIRMQFGIKDTPSSTQYFLSPDSDINHKKNNNILSSDFTN